MVPPSPQASRLQELRSRFHPGMGLITGCVYGVGYHTALPGLSPAHPYRENAIHAYAFLRSPDAGDQDLGRRLLARVLAAQDVDPASPWYGLWSWFAEEPLPAMHPADWNWADFLGSTLLEILRDAPDRLTPELLAATRSATGHAAWSIFRRNPTLDYTNIAILGTAVTLAAGFALDEPRLLAFGRARLRALRAHIAARGVKEYNSPNYYQGDIGDLERMLALPLDPDLRADAEFLREIFWGQIARHFHAPTAQWAGPQSRTYANWLDAKTTAFLEARLGFALPPPQLQSASAAAQPPGWDDPPVIHARALACPEPLRAAFREPPPAPREHVEVWTHEETGAPGIVTTTWSDATASLGSVQSECFWTQCRPITGYWLGENAAPGRLRVRVLLNGRDFCSAQLWAAQRGPVILGAIEFLPGRGTFHILFDKPANGIFALNDLRLRFEVEGDTPSVQPTGEHTWSLTASGSTLHLRTDAIWFNGQPHAPWEPGGKGRCAWLDAVFARGDAIPFHPGTAGRTGTAFALAWSPAAPPPGPLHVSTDGRSVTLGQPESPWTLQVPPPDPA